MKFNKFTDFHDFGLRNSVKCLRFTLFTARSENDDFSRFLQKLRRMIENDTKIKIGNMKITENLIFQFSTLMQEAGNQLFPFFYEKVEDSLKSLNLLKILEFPLV